MTNFPASEYVESKVLDVVGTSVTVGKNPRRVIMDEARRKYAFKNSANGHLCGPSSFDPVASRVDGQR